MPTFAIPAAPPASFLRGNCIFGDDQLPWPASKRQRDCFRMICDRPTSRKPFTVVRPGLGFPWVPRSPPGQDYGFSPKITHTGPDRGSYRKRLLGCVNGVSAVSLSSGRLLNGLDAVRPRYPRDAKRWEASLSNYASCVIVESHKCAVRLFWSSSATSPSGECRREVPRL